MMRVLLITTDYPAFLASFYAAEPGVAQAGYGEQMRRRNDTLFANADFYSRGLRAAGAAAADLYMNNEIMQRQWARENGFRVPGPSWRARLKPVLLRVPVIARIAAVPGAGRPPWLVPILAAQIKAFRPDVIFNEDMHVMDAATLRRIGGTVRLIVGNTNSYRDPRIAYGDYDLILTAFPNYAQDFKDLRIPAVLSRLAFEPTVLDRLRPATRSIPVSFVGSFDTYHGERRALLEYLCERVDIAIWGPGIDSLPAASPIRRRYRGTAWGRDMMQIFAESEIVINHELPISSPYGANMRFYEATGCGALLLTDRRDVSGMFEPDRELVFYDDPADCVRQIETLLGDGARRRAIAEAGQRRTLRDHTYGARAAEMLAIFERFMEAPRERRVAGAA